jgi:hypothetical protein
MKDEVISSERLPREGWEDVFRAALPSAHEELLLDALPVNEFDGTDWQW